MMPKKLIGPSTRLFPMPTLMVCVKTGKDKANILTIAWGGIVAGSPPCIGICVGKDHYSTPFIRQERNFTINIPNSQQDIAADYCGIVSGEKVHQDLFSTDCRLSYELRMHFIQGN
jgi:flavin reductase (DIM6/NTAB) family NADH-FMN oxidoreductase RutF